MKKKFLENILKRLCLIFIYFLLKKNFDTKRNLEKLHGKNKRKVFDKTNLVYKFKAMYKKEYFIFKKFPFHDKIGFAQFYLRKGDTLFQNHRFFILKKFVSFQRKKNRDLDCVTEFFIGILELSLYLTIA